MAKGCQAKQSKRFSAPPTWVLLLSASLLCGPEWLGAEKPPQYEADIHPLLARYCLSCHSNENATADDLSLESLAAILRGGSGGPAVDPHSADSSLILQRLLDGSMPPGDDAKPTQQEIGIVRAWIEAGAPSAQASQPEPVEAKSPVSQEDRSFWAFRRLETPTLPQVDRRDRLRTPIDAFILGKLEDEGLDFSPDADPATLVRRLHLDLLGLPPAPEQVAAFVRNPSETSYRQLVDDLLASPHFGERWGRHWLDAAGFVDTIGGDVDAPRIKLGEGKWRYRDYVVNAFNQDKPYDRFLLEQLAGDELVEWRSAPRFTPEMLDLLVATTFLRAAADDTDEGVLNTLDIRYGVLQRTLETFTSNVLALTVACAQCHDHKYDPIPQQDYYRLTAIFTPAWNPHSWLQPKDRRLADVAPVEKAGIDEKNEKIETAAAPLLRKLRSLYSPYEERLLEKRLQQLPETLRQDVKDALQVPAQLRTPVEKYLVEKLEPLVGVSRDEVSPHLSETERTRAQGLQEQLAEIETERASYGYLQAVYDVGPPPTTHLLRRGNYLTPGPEVTPGFLSVLAEEKGSLAIQDWSLRKETSGRRLALGQWLTRPDSRVSALVARVIVNRMWQYLFGEGIVATSDNFGRNGARPTHPQLLEWLAGELIAGGWRLKPVLRLMLNSTVYRQASHRTGETGDIRPERVDPGNRLLWRMRLRRLEAEAIRDSILAISGKLNPAMGGPSILVKARPDGVVLVSEPDLAQPGDRFRRSIYLLTRRNYNLSFMTVFDHPVMSTNCTRRDDSAVVLQSLSLLNNEFVLDNAQHFADQLLAAGGETVTMIRQAFQAALARPPNPQEEVWSQQLLADEVRRSLERNVAPPEAQRRAMASLCQMLFNTNEFLHVE